MKLDVPWLLNVIGSALVMGASLRLFLYLTKRVLALEFPLKQRSLMILGLILVSTITGASHDIRFAAILFPAILTGWFVIHWTRKWTD